jgi:hypothetical protein
MRKWLAPLSILKFQMVPCRTGELLKQGTCRKSSGLGARQICDGRNWPVCGREKFRFEPAPVLVLKMITIRITLRRDTPGWKIKKIYSWTGTFTGLILILCSGLSPSGVSSKTFYKISSHHLLIVWNDPKFVLLLAAIHATRSGDFGEQAFSVQPL